MQSVSASQLMALQSADVKLEALPRQQAGQFMIANVSGVTLSSKHGLASVEQTRSPPSQLTDSLTDGAAGLVFSSVASQLRPAASTNT